ncbi:hypothetical protein NBRC10512_001298 [Rhodotorula toruloides]|uniref:glutathione transferase n=2 Tax=Rhodotorula toruloides TaxID=5286 RepID=A0A061BDU0_RHOTO|nr:Glutathione S-transferase [Rhodotorula toruloides NP11]EMS20986.1 Glutathione S-transferase [Rhodotorula toruloides NP11]CDR48101.1 RHTO0S16e01266g1_1 [Rhodotorula toruloides]
MSTDNVPKAVLYWFGGSVWASVPRLTAAEKGFTENELETRIVDLAKGENFAPAFLRINPKGTVPALVVPYAHTVEEGITTKFKALNSTIEICDFLDRSTVRSVHHSAPVLSPATVQRSAVSKEIIENVHRDDVNPNTLLLLWRSEDERQAKLGGMVGGFLKGRQEALERYAKEVGSSDAKLKEFYEGKIKENGGLLALLEGKGDSSDIQKKAQELWTNVGRVFDFLENRFEPAAPYLIGDQISLADLHAGAWLARVLACAGATSLNDVDSNLSTLESNLNGVKVGPKTAAWAKALFERDSFKQVYGEGLH